VGGSGKSDCTAPSPPMSIRIVPGLTVRILRRTTGCTPLNRTACQDMQMLFAERRIVLSRVRGMCWRRGRRGKFCYGVTGSSSRLRVVNSLTVAAQIVILVKSRKIVAFSLFGMSAEFRDLLTNLERESKVIEKDIPILVRGMEL
jgi:hypothetical protein